MKRAGLVLIIGAWILLQSFSLAAFAEEYEEIQLTSFPVDHFNPDIYGRNMVWEDTRSDTKDIYFYDLGEDGIPKTEDDDFGGRNQETPLFIGAGDQVNPVVSERFVVWEDLSSGEGDIKLYDMGADGLFNTSDDAGLSTVSSEGHQQLNPDVWGDYVVWQDERYGIDHSAIYLYKVSTSERTEIAYSDTTNNHNPSIWGDYVVWEQNEGIGSHIAYYHIPTGATETVDAYGDEFFPSIWGDRIIFMSFPPGTGSSNVVLYDIGAESRENVTGLVTTNSNTIPPVVFGDNIAWVDKGNGSHIMLYNLLENTTSSLDNVSTNVYGLALGDKLVVWEDDPLTIHHLFGVRLEPPTSPVHDDRSTKGDGNTYVFETGVTWEMGANSTWVVYSLDDSSGEKFNLSMTLEDGMFTKEIPLPSDTETVYYHFVVEDLLGEWHVGAEESISVKEDVDDEESDILLFIGVGIIAVIGIIVLFKLGSKK